MTEVTTNTTDCNDRPVVRVLGWDKKVYYHKTSNKRPRRLFEHLTNTPPAFNRDLAFIGDPAFIRILYKMANTGTRQSGKLRLIYQ